MHGSALFVCRLLFALLLVVGVATPGLAGPKENPDPSQDDGPKPPDPDVGFSSVSNPVPAPEGEPDDYMDRFGRSNLLVVEYVGAVTRWVAWLVR